MKIVAKIGISLLLVAGILSLAAMNVSDKGVRKQPSVKLSTARDVISRNKHTIDSAVSLLRSGDVVLRTGLGADSYLLSRFNRKDKTYSHCGIVMMEHGYPFVYHSIGGEDNPDERLRRDSANFFFSPVHNTGLAIVRYDFSAANVSDLKNVVSAYYRTRPKFDMKFDLATDDKLYCAEFVYKAINKTMCDTGYIIPTSVMGMRFVGTDDLFFNKHAHMILRAIYK